MSTKEPCVALLEVQLVLLEAIPLGGLPAGALYAAAMGSVTLEQFRGLFDVLAEAGAITRKNNWLARGESYGLAVRNLTALLERLNSEEAA